MANSMLVLVVRSMLFCEVIKYRRLLCTFVALLQSECIYTQDPWREIKIYICTKLGKYRFVESCIKVCTQQLNK